MITGAPGTGKTTMINDLLASLDNEKFIIARIECMHMEREDLLRLLALSLNMDVATGLDLTELLHRTKQFLIEQRKLGRKALLIIDEAQVLTSAALEELRLLQNMQEEGQVLLHVYLFGQEELVELINSPEVAQLRERLMAAYQIDPLTSEQTEDYIKYRLSAVGWKGDPAFHEGVFPLIYQLSQGIPRRINLLCNRLLTQGFYNEQHELSVQDVRRVLDVLRNERLIPIEHDIELESSMRPPHAQQDELRVSGLKRAVSSVLQTRENSTADDTEELERSPIILNSTVATQKKSLQSRKLWPLFVFSVFLGMSLLGLIMAFLLTFSERLSTALLPSQWQHVDQQENPLGVEPEDETAEANNASPETPNSINDSSQKKSEHLTGIQTHDEGREPASTKQKRSEPESMSAGIQQKSANTGIDLRMQNPNSQESSEATELNQSNKATTDQARVKGNDQIQNLEQKNQKQKNTGSTAGANAKQPNERAEMQADTSHTPDVDKLKVKGIAQETLGNHVSELPSDLVSESTQASQTQISELLKQATKQRAEFKVTKPKGDNAFETYQLILAQDPANKAAKQGIIELVDYYLERALLYKNESSPQRSLSFINRGLKIVPDHSQLLKLRGEVQNNLDKPK
jgi:type II secretory pathway predicted ATPase ExeA